jgi:hypothetical protein
VYVKWCGQTATPPRSPPAARCALVLLREGCATKKGHLRCATCSRAVPVQYRQGWCEEKAIQSVRPPGWPKSSRGQQPGVAG